ncbi:TetR/AcrR family transcriptional regulator [Actinoallomurus iriomotensis]|uniref:TetR family transcriptional regulator n=1 Tax=Actinoallomurus iriomotensis TaxID=478107 RepID=A0A9W6VNP8_9ACTN|nr:TetR/AcrR family transcriptional regulator [Actinoallomurus iriomotensis]GLY79028.1 TetR family transcriptional regulator [Actinoallomurus iriomotensis]
MGRSSDARERLVRAAARLFLARGYQAVGVDEVCAATGVPRGTFYYFFRSKSELVNAVVDRHALALWARLEAAGAVDGADHAARRLHAVADAVGEIQAGFELRFGALVGCPFGTLAAELAGADESVREHLASVFADWEERLAVLCRHAADQGTLRPGVDPVLLARILLAQFQGMILLARTGRSTVAEIPATLHQIIDSHLLEGAST